MSKNKPISPKAILSNKFIRELYWNGIWGDEAINASLRNLLTEKGLIDREGFYKINETDWTPNDK
jgi:hypothetical protein